MKPDLIGGQAVIEGVMMRNNDRLCIAVRDQSKEISLKLQRVNSLSQKYKFLKLPILRGMVAFFESLVLGIKTLTYSADKALEEEEEEITDFQMFLTVAASLALGIGLFFFLPTLVMGAIKGPMEIPLFINLGEGVLRILIFVAYVFFISRMKDIQRVFEYHGAEHKAVNCYEAGEELTVENAQKHSTLHPRCGTSFLLIVMLVSIILFSFFGWPNIWLRFVIRLAILPVIAGLSYEAIRLAGRSKGALAKALSYPGMMLQALTTREPDNSQLEVAIAALEKVSGSGQEPS